MNTDIKQAMHVEAGKSFGTAEANENERHWNDDKIDRKNQDPTNHYDKTRMKLNFEIGPDGKVHPLGYQEKSLEVRLQERLTELGWKPFKPDSKIQPNCCAKFIFGGNHDRTLEMAFGPQTVNLDKGADQATYPECIKIIHGQTSVSLLMCSMTTPWAIPATDSPSLKLTLESMAPVGTKRTRFQKPDTTRGRI